MGINILISEVSFDLLFDLGEGDVLMCRFNRKSNDPTFSNLMYVAEDDYRFIYNNIDDLIKKIKLEKLLSQKSIHKLKNRVLQSVLELLDTR